MTRRTFTVLAIAGALALAGCAAEPAPTPTRSQSVIAGSDQTPTPEPSPPPAPDPEVDVTPTPVVTETPLPTAAPSCDELISLDWLQSKLDPRIGKPMEYTHRYRADALPGPVAQKVFTSATLLRACAWAIPDSDAGFSVAVLSVPKGPQDELVAAMASSSIYDLRPEHSFPSYSRNLTDGIGWGFAQGFDGGYWAVAQGSLTDPDMSSDLVEMALGASLAAQ